MTKILNACTEYIPLYNAEGAPLGIINDLKRFNHPSRSPSRHSSSSSSSDDDENGKEKEESHHTRRRRRRRQQHNEDAAEQEDRDDEENEENGEDDEEDSDNDGVLHLLNLGNAPSNNAHVAHIDIDEKEQMYYSFFLLTVSKNFYNTFTPIIVTEGTHEKRELDLYIEAPTFQFANEIGFGPDVPMNMCLLAISKLRRFLKSLDMRVSVGDPRFLEAVLNCPSLKNLHIQPENYQDLTELEHIFHVCTTLIQRHQNIALRGNAARVLAVKVFNCADIVGVHQLMIKYDVIRIAREALLRDKYNHAETFRDYMACIESIIVIENVNRRGVSVPIENITPLSEFTDAIDMVEDIFENGDGRFLYTPEVMPFLLNFFVKMVSVPRLGREAYISPIGMRGQEPIPATPDQLRAHQEDFADFIAQHGGNQNNQNNNNNQQRQQRQRPPSRFYIHPCEQRKIDFVKRYRETLIPHLFDLLSKVTSLSNPLDSDVVTRIFAIIIELLNDKYWCDTAAAGAGVTVGSGVETESWCNMIRSGRPSLQHFPFDSVTKIVGRIAREKEKSIGGIFAAVIFLCATTLTYVSSNERIDEEAKERVPLVLQCKLIEEYVHMLEFDKDGDGDDFDMGGKYNILRSLQNLIDPDFSSGEFPRDHFVDHVAKFFTSTSINSTIGKFIVAKTPELEQKLLSRSKRGKFSVASCESIDAFLDETRPKYFLKYNQDIDTLNMAVTILADTELQMDISEEEDDDDKKSIFQKVEGLSDARYVVSAMAERYNICASQANGEGHLQGFDDDDDDENEEDFDQDEDDEFMFADGAEQMMMDEDGFDHDDEFDEDEEDFHYDDDGYEYDEENEAMMLNPGDEDGNGFEDDNSDGYYDDDLSDTEENYFKRLEQQGGGKHHSSSDDDDEDFDEEDFDDDEGAMDGYYGGDFEYDEEDEGFDEDEDDEEEYFDESDDDLEQEDNRYNRRPDANQIKALMAQAHAQLAQLQQQRQSGARRQRTNEKNVAPPAPRHHQTARNNTTTTKKKSKETKQQEKQNQPQQKGKKDNRRRK